VTTSYSLNPKQNKIKLESEEKELNLQAV